MKKTVALLLTIALTLTLTACPEPNPDPQCECTDKVHPNGSPCTCPAAGTSACDCTEGQAPHTHTYSTTWSYNATQHWKECTAGDGAKTDIANHTFNGNICSVCNYNNGSGGGGGSDTEANPFPLTAGVWTDGTVSASDTTKWYSFTAIGGTTYYLWWNDSDQGNGSKTADVKVSAYQNDGTAIGTENVDRGWATPKQILVNVTGTVRIKVVPYSSSAIGTFALVYSTSSTRPSVGASIEGSTFTSISEFNTALADSPANTRETAYNVNINVSNLGGAYNASGSLGRALRDNNTKYVKINLTGSTITSIPNDSFRNCSSLAGITIGGSVVSIGTYAFSGCTSLAAVTMGSGVTSIGEAAFYGDTLLTDVTIGSGVTSIGASAFRNCNSLASITIPNSVTSIGNDAFNGCIGLTGITIPNSVTSIGSSAFTGCTILSSVTFTATSKVASIGSSAFSGCTILSGIIIPDSVTLIDRYAFDNCTNLASATIGSAVATIDSYAFRGCTNLVTVTFRGSSTSISNSNVFPGDLRAKYLAANTGGAGTYINAGGTWTKQ